MKQAQGLSINTMILIVLGLLVLVVVGTVLVRQGANFTKETQGCERKGGTCALECGFGPALSRPIQIDGACVEGQVCCVG